MNRKTGLGRGLGALIPAEYNEEQDRAAGIGVHEVPVANVRPNPRQPREHFDEESLAGLTASVAELGVLQPILVRALGDGGYELIAGERRWRASKRAGLQTIPVVVRDADTDVSLLEQALVENLHREDLNAMEEAAAYRQLIDDFGLTQDAVAKRVGKSRVAVSNTLRLFQLPPAIQSLVADGELSAGHARALLGTPDRAFQTALAQRIIRDGLSVREAENAVRARAGVTVDTGRTEAPDSPQKATQKERPLPEPGLLELQQLLGDHLDTRVLIQKGTSNGSIRIDFADIEDLERIYRRMIGATADH